MPNLVERADALQRRKRALGFPLGVVYKFFDDQGNYLAAILTYYAFIAIFPLLLIASSILGFLLRGNDQLQQQLLSSALAQFPIVGTQLGRPEGLQGSASAVVVGTLAALYGVTGVGQAAQNALNVAWAVPRNSRRNPFHSRLVSLLLLVVGGLSVLLVAILPSLAGQMGGVWANGVAQWIVTIASIALTAVVLTTIMSLATPGPRRLVEELPGAVAVAIMWHLLQALGGVYVGQVVNRASDINGLFALVLGLIVLIYIASVMAVIGVEINVVHTKGLYPRALLTPFTDDVELTPADRQAYGDYARAQRHKGFERVDVEFVAQADRDDHSDTGDEKVPDDPPVSRVKRH